MINMIGKSTLRRFYASASTPKKTALYDFHVQHKGKMVDFAGWDMPVSYDKLGALASHIWTRENASLFDVSHMLQTKWVGKDRIRFLESLVVADIQSLPLGKSTLSMFTNVKGGIIDDIIINKQSESNLYMVSNAGSADKVLKHVRKQLSDFQNKGGDVNFEILDKSLVALQGPKAAQVVEELSGKSLAKFGFMSAQFSEVKGIPLYMSRCGYTGEDGFELSVSHNDVAKLAELLVDHPAVELAGLGARDSLRIEAGLCLYGHDIDEETTPVEGGLTWTIGKRRRETADFLGAEHILPQIKGGVSQRRVGFVVSGAPARENAEIFSKEGELIGKITSGCPAPMLKKNVAMGYIKSGFHKSGTEVSIKVRGKLQPAIVTKMPFVPHRYYSGEQ